MFDAEKKMTNNKMIEINLGSVWKEDSVTQKE